MEKFGTHKVALVAFALLCSGMVTASSADRVQLPKTLPLGLTQANTPNREVQKRKSSEDAFALIKAQLAQEKNKTRTLENALRKFRKKSEAAKNTQEEIASLKEQLSAVEEIAEERARRAEALEKSGIDERSKLLRRIAIQKATIDRLTAENATLAAQKTKKSRKAKLKEAVTNAAKALKRSDTTVIHPNENY